MPVRPEPLNAGAFALLRTCTCCFVIAFVICVILVCVIVICVLYSFVLQSTVWKLATVRLRSADDLLVHPLAVFLACFAYLALATALSLLHMIHIGR